MTLALAATGSVPVGTLYTIVSNDGTDPTVGAFSDLPNGSIIPSGADFFQIFYNFAGSNDVVLISTGSAAPPDVYVSNTAWIGFTPGEMIADADPGLSGNQSAFFDVDAFPDMQDAIAAVATGGAIVVQSGNYIDPFTVAKNVTLDLHNGTVTFSAAIDGSSSLTKTGSSTLVLAADDTAYMGTTTISQGILQLGVTGTHSAGGTAGIVGGPIVDNANLTFSRSDSPTFAQAISGTGVVDKTGNGTLSLTGTNSYLGGTSVLRGNLLVTSDAQLGDPSGDVTVTTPGELDVSGSVTSSRIFALDNGSTLAVVSGTLTLDGAEVDGGTLAGPGTVVAASDPVAFDGTTLTAALTVNVSSALTNFQDGGSVELSAGTTSTLNHFTVLSSGSLTVDGTGNVTTFLSNGVVTVDSGPSGGSVGGVLANVGTSAGLTFGGGSVTTIHGADTTDEGHPPANSGFIDLGAVAGSVAGGLLINDGFIGSSTSSSIPLNVGFGALVDGYGTFGLVVTSNGGRLSPGHSPGGASTNDFDVNNGGTFEFDISDATGTAGSSDGWDQFLVAPNRLSPPPTITFFPGATFNIVIDSLSQSSDTSAPAANFNPSLPYAWSFVAGQGATIVNAADFATTNFTIDVSGFTLQSGGVTPSDFSVEFRDTDNNGSADSLFVVYTRRQAWAPVSYSGTENIPFVAGGVGNPSGVLAGFQDPAVVVTQVNNMSISGGPVTVANGTVSMSANGNFTFDPNLDFNGPTSFAFTASDGYGKTTTGTVNLTIAHVNQPPVLTLGAPSITYNDTPAFDSFAPLISSMSVVDPDGPTAVFSATGAISDMSQSGYNLSVAGNYGTLYLSSSSGAYEYLPNNAAINALTTTQMDNFTLTVNDQGSPPLSDSKPFAVTLVGVNDAAIVSGTTTGAVTEAGGVNNSILGIPTATGMLTDTDVDNPPNTFTAVTSPTPSAGGYGSFTSTAGGGWTFSLDNNSPIVQALTAGQIVLDSFTVTTIDGTPQKRSLDHNHRRQRRGRHHRHDDRHRH